MLQEELPAEMSFHVPEIYHKRIIGVGGKNIQRIMKKYGVYVKFSNAEEFASLGGYLDNEDNVVARTPAKNSASLDHLKQAVMEMVIPKDKDFVIETVSIPRRYHRTLLGEKSIFIHDIETKTNSIVRFPNKETASDIVNIFGPESQVHIAAQMLLDHVPFEAEYRLPHSEQTAQLALTQDFLELQERIKRDLNITILPWVDRSGAGEETIIRFLLNRSNQHFLTTSRDTVEEFLLSKNVSRGHICLGSSQLTLALRRFGYIPVACDLDQIALRLPSRSSIASFFRLWRMKLRHLQPQLRPEHRSRLFGQLLLHQISKLYLMDLLRLQHITTCLQIRRPLRPVSVLSSSLN